jgi:H+/Cl- antiporter ClcA
MTELTGQDRALILPILLAVITATVVSRSIEPRSIYDARLTDAEVVSRIRSRDPQGHA